MANRSILKKSIIASSAVVIVQKQAAIRKVFGLRSAAVKLWPDDLIEAIDPWSAIGERQTLP